MQSQILAKACIDREKVLRLKWFRKNEENLELLATRPNIRKVSSQTLEKYDKLREDLAHQDRNVRRKMQDVLIEYEGAKYNVMKPVDPNVTQIIYKDTMGYGRIKYMKERTKSKPEERYYFPECSSFVYGWKMWNYSTDNPIKRYGKSKIVRTSFYRRRGVGRDPDWYTDCAKINATVCGMI